MKNDFLAFVLICVLPGLVYLWLINLISSSPPPVKPKEVTLVASIQLHLSPNKDLRSIYGWKNPYNVELRK